MTLKDINWNQVYYFYEVARRLSMKDAAHSSGVSLPTVSEQIKRLETSLNVVLFKRFPRRLELTATGEALYQYAKEMFDSGSRFLNVISSSAGICKARVALQASIAEKIQVEFVQRYLEAFNPYGILNTVQEHGFDHLLERMLKGEFDWALTFEAASSLRLSSTPIARCELVLVCAKDIEAQTAGEVLQRLPLARSSWDFQLNQMVEDQLAHDQIFPVDILELDHAELCLARVEQGLCVTTLLRSSLAQYPGLRPLPLSRPLELTCFAVWLKSHERSTPVRVLCDLVHPAGSERGVAFTAKTLPADQDEAILHQDPLQVASGRIRGEHSLES